MRPALVSPASEPCLWPLKPAGGLDASETLALAALQMGNLLEAFRTLGAAKTLFVTFHGERKALFQAMFEDELGRSGIGLHFGSGSWGFVL